MEFEHRREIPAEPRVVFDVVANRETLGNWAPEGVEVEPSDTPGGLHAWVTSGSEVYDAEGFVNVDSDELRLEWGGNGGEGYDGWLQVEQDERGEQSSSGHSTVTLHLTFAGDQAEALGGELSEEADQRMEQALDRLAALVADQNESR